MATWHATTILACLEQHDAAPRSAKPTGTLQSSLQRLKETGEIENTGRHYWRLRTAVPEAVAPSPTVSAADATVSAPPTGRHFSREARLDPMGRPLTADLASLDLS